MKESRKEFLLKVLTGGVYAAPVVRSLAAPDGLLGQDHNETTEKGGMGKKGDPGATTPASQSAPTVQDSAASRRAPWEAPPPGGGGTD